MAERGVKNSAMDRIIAAVRELLRTEMFMPMKPATPNGGIRTTAQVARLSWPAA